MKRLAIAALAAFLVAGPSVTIAACTKQQGQTAVATAVQVAVDLCQESAAALPPPAPTLIALVCTDSTGAAITVWIDNAIWGSLKAKYLAEHGALPKGYAPLDASAHKGDQ